MSHATNVSVGHETRVDLYDGRVVYPQDHIEIDNRLAWFLGLLEETYGDEARYVHLERDPDKVASSMLRRWERQIDSRHPAKVATTAPRILAARLRNYLRDPFSTYPFGEVNALAYGLLMPSEPWRPAERRAIADLYVKVVTANINAFLRDKSSVHRVAVEHFPRDVAKLWTGLDLSGDWDAALQELSIRHNAERRGE